MPSPLSRLMCAALCLAALMALAACGKKPAPPAAAHAAAAPVVRPAAGAEPPADIEEPPPNSVAPLAVSPIAPAPPSTPAEPSARAMPQAPASHRSAIHSVNADVLSECTHAASAILGAGAEVLRCGPLSQPGVLEALAIQRKHKRLGHEQDIFASRVVILRKQQFGWILALDVAQKLKNEAGYIATGYVAEGTPLWGYRVKLHETLPDDSRKHFTLEVGAMHDERDAFDPGTEIAWDPRVRRYREYNTDEGRGVFEAENTSPLPEHPARKAPAKTGAPSAPPKTAPPVGAPKAT